jgi:hypothetical protein
VKRIIKDWLGPILLLAGWISLLISGLLYPLYWRVDNEPGASGTALLIAALSFCSLGGLAFLGGNLLVIRKKAWWVLAIGWFLCAGLLAGALSLTPILLLLMV